jgi:hypothetical protein
MREELLKLSSQLENVTAILAEIVEKETVQGEVLLSLPEDNVISFTRPELRKLLNTFHDSIVNQAAENDVSHDLIDVSFDLDYDHRVTLHEAYLSKGFLDFDVEGFLIDAIQEKIKKEVREENENTENTNVNTSDTANQLQCQ